MPQRDPRRGAARWTVMAGAGIVVLALGAAAWLALRAPITPEPTPPDPAPSPSPEAPRYYLIVDLRRVDEVATSDRVREREVQAAAESVRETMAGVYSAGFVTPELWAGGRFPSLFGYFTGHARAEARRDVQDLSLGRTASRLAAVRPDRARVNVRVLVDGGGHPISAIVGMEFRATGLVSEDATLPIRHDGRYVLRRIGGRWLIVAYDVRGRLGTGGSR